MKVGTFPFFALFGLLTVVHSAHSNTLAQEEVYREAVTDGYVIDNFYLNWFTTASSKIPGAAQTSQQPSPEEGDISEASGDTSDEAKTSVDLQYGGKAATATPKAWNTDQPLSESKESDLLEGSGDTIITSVFHQHHVSTTTSVLPDWSTQQSKESDLLEESRDTADVSIFLQNGSKHDVSTTVSVSPGWSTDQSSLEFKENDLLEQPGVTTDTSVFLQHGGEHHVSTTTSVLSDWSTQQSKESDLLEESRDKADVSIFLQNGSKHDVSTTVSVSPGWSTDQPTLESKENDLLEGSGDTTDTSVFLQHGGEHHVSTTTSVSPDWSTQQSKESDLLEGSGDTTDVSIFFQNGSKHDVSTTTSVLPAWSTQQSKESDLLEGSGDTTDVFIFFQNGSKHDVSTTPSVSPAWSTQQPSLESEESDSLKGSGVTTDLPIFSQHGPKPDVSTTANVTHTRSPSTAVLPGDADSSGSGDVRLSDGEIIHSTTSSSVSVSYTDTSLTSSISTPVVKRTFSSLQRNAVINLGAANVQSELQKEEPTLLPSVGQKTPGWIIILAFIVGVAALIMVCIAIATRDKWNALKKAHSPDSESKMKSINQQRDVEMETFLQKDQPRENGRVTEYTVIPLDDLPEKYSSD